jgi:hypothetical protein
MNWFCSLQVGLGPGTDTAGIQSFGTFIIQVHSKSFNKNLIMISYKPILRKVYLSCGIRWKTNGERKKGLGYLNQKEFGRKPPVG